VATKSSERRASTRHTLSGKEICNHRLLRKYTILAIFKPISEADYFLKNAGYKSALSFVLIKSVEFDESGT
jgi:hypothetical protein